MDVEFLIIGQGLSGSFLAMELMKEKRSVVVIDDGNKFSASRVASGIINPVTGRRIVKTWMIDELLPYAKNVYEQLQQHFNTQLIRQLTTVDFFPTPQMLLAFRKRVEEGADYLQLPEDNQNWRSFVNYDFTFGFIDPCFLIDVEVLLHSVREELLLQGCILSEKFEQDKLVLANHRVGYKNIKAEKLVYCDGISSFDNPYFGLLPFAPNKGELLIAEINDLPSNAILKYGLTIVPWKNDQFWVGASHEWKFENDQPTTAFREQTIVQLKRILKLPFTIVDHFAAVRPATLERRPFVGVHPLYPQLGIFNGMGTKGCSLAPYFARQFVQFLIHNKPLLPEVDVNRFQNILRIQ